MKEPEGIHEDGFNGWVHISAWEKVGYKKLDDSIPGWNQRVTFLDHPNPAYGSQRTEWTGYLIDNDTVCANGGIKPITYFTHWREVES